VTRPSARGLRGLIAGLSAAAAVSLATEPAPRSVSIVYLSREQPAAARASLSEPASAHYGLEGAQFGLEESNNSGRFLGLEYRLLKVVVPPDGDAGAAVRREVAAGHRLVLADLEGADLLAAASVPEAAEALILDTRTSDDRLRQADCRDNVFHLLPSWAMRADALGQYLQTRHWQRWFLLRGAAPADQDFSAALKRAAVRFGATIVAEKSYDPGSDSADPDTARQQIQTRMPGITRLGVPYDMVMVADTTSSFGDYLLFNTAEPRPVAGTHGLVAEAWDPQFREYAARGVLYRFFRMTGREMTERDYGNWLGMAVIAEAVTRGAAPDPRSIRKYILSERFSLAANKGEGLTFRRWDHQLRQPLLLFGQRVLVSMAPLSEYRHPGYQTDTLGFDESDSECRRAR